VACHSHPGRAAEKLHDEYEQLGFGFEPPRHRKSQPNARSRLAGSAEAQPFPLVHPRNRQLRVYRTEDVLTIKPPSGPAPTNSEHLNSMPLFSYVVRKARPLIE
jgi:hypothetical protein